MANTVLPSGNTQFNLTYNFQTVIVEAGAVRSTASSYGINGASLDYTTVIIEGSVSSRNGYRSGVESYTDYPTLIVTKTGMLFGNNYGALAYGDAALVSNSGRIEGGTQSGVRVTGADVAVINSGVIKGGKYGLDNFRYAANVENSGKIIGDDAGYYSYTDRGAAGAHFENSGLVKGGIGISFAATGGQDYVVNTGKINGTGGVGIDGNNSRQTVINDGVILGDVNLQGSDDVYIGRTGKVEGTVSGGTGNDFLRGGKFADRIKGDNNNDDIRGGNGNDKLWGGNQHDHLAGGRGNDVVRGEGGWDTLDGGRGDDKVLGGDDADFVHGNLGNDKLWGGSGADDFYFKGNAGRDVIFDFENGIDVIDLSWFNVTMSFNKFEKKAIDYRNGNAHIDLDKIGGDGEIVVRNISDLDASDFVF